MTKLRLMIKPVPNGTTFDHVIISKSNPRQLWFLNKGVTIEQERQRIAKMNNPVLTEVFNAVFAN